MRPAQCIPTRAARQSPQCEKLRRDVVAAMHADQGALRFAPLRYLPPRVAPRTPLEPCRRPPSTGLPPPQLSAALLEGCRLGVESPSHPCHVIGGSRVQEQDLVAVDEHPRHKQRRCKHMQWFAKHLQAKFDQINSLQGAKCGEIIAVSKDFQTLRRPEKSVASSCSC